MASTNKTTNYELSQFLGTDKPAWLSDYNGDMNKIDTQMKANADGVTAASGASSANTTAIGTLANLTTTAKTDLVNAINEVDSNADTAQSTANAAASNANIANTNIAKFNLTNISELTVTSNVGTVGSLTHLYIAKDSSNSVFKLYGRVEINNLGGVSGTLSVSISSTGLNPDTAYNISAAGLEIRELTDGSDSVRPRDITVNTDGTITIQSFPKTLFGDTATDIVEFFPCIYFNKNFGDE